MKGLLEETIVHKIGRKLLNNWVHVSLWSKACFAIAHESSFKEFFEENKQLSPEPTLKRCLSKDPFGAILEVFTSVPFVVNKSGIFMLTIGREKYLYITDKRGLFAPVQPIIDSVFWDQVNDTKTKFGRSLRPLTRRHSLLDIGDIDPAIESEQMRLDIHVGAEGPPHEEEHDNDGDDGDILLGDPFWESSEARKLFGARPMDSDAQVTLKRKIEHLKIINQQKKIGYKLIIDGGDADNECTETDIIRLKEWSLILLLTYKACLRGMGKNGALFASCIHDVLHYLEDTGIDQHLDPDVPPN